MAEITEIEKFIIEKVKEIRNDKKISQQKLSSMIGLSEGFIGNVENENRPEKYNIRHLNAIAKVLNCSPREFWPDVAI
jgi:transcriptional regulator with XRE-family HTH domain